MTKEEILKGNKLIAEFMMKGNSEIYIPEYHHSWNWLMPVVEKIQHLEGNNKISVNIDFQIHLLGAVELWLDNKRVFGMTAFEVGTLIDAVYEGVIQFIKWYNKEKELCKSNL